MHDEEFKIKLGYKIKILRERKKLSQEGLAAIIDKEKGYIGKIENGRGNPSVLYLKKIAEGLDVDITELFNFTI